MSSQLPKVHPVVAVGDRLSILWPVASDASSPSELQRETMEAEVISIEKSSKAKQGSFYKYNLKFDDDNTRSTRLLHLQWSNLGNVANQESRQHLEQTEATSSNTKSKKRKRDFSVVACNCEPEVSSKCLPVHKFILAPMVGGSELAFRLLCRKYGAELAYTPMINSEKFAVDEEYRRQEFQTTPEDHPVVAHFSGNNPDIMLAAARHVEKRCEAIDLNLGCPQRVAFTGHFGSYLLDESDRDTVVSIVKNLSSNISIPVFVKIRLLDSVPDTIRLCEQLIEAGAALITIHARYRVNLVGRTGPGARDGAAHLDQVKEVKEALEVKYNGHLSVPIIANGNIKSWEDCLENLSLTNADGVMSAEGLLDDPALFFPNAKMKHISKPSKLELALEYLALVDQYPVKMKSVIFHVRRICRDEFTKYQLMEDCVTAESVEMVRAIVQRAMGYETGAEDFAFDQIKENQARHAAERRKRDEGKRKEFEARMTRKAKREGKPLDHFLKLGAEVPTIEELQAMKALPRERSFELWKQNHSQHCYAFHFDANSCPRERTCAFLHADPSYSEAVAFG